MLKSGILIARYRCMEQRDSAMARFLFYVFPFVALILLLGVNGGVVHAEEEFAHPGYLADVSEERYQITREVVIAPLLTTEKTRLVDQIFTEKMSREFSKEFRHRFGYTEFEQLSFTSNRFVESNESGRLVPVDEYIEQQEDFGLYMAKELTEYHVDNYLKGNPSTREVYRVKEKISNVEVATKTGYKLKLRYKISSNRMTLKAEKPNERFHQQVDMKVSEWNPTIRLSYDVAPTVRLGTDYTIEDEILSVRGEKRLTASLSTSITGQAYNKELDASTPKQNRVLLGLSWTD